MSTWILKIRISCNDGNFLTNFSRTTLLHGVAVCAVLNKCPQACRIQAPNVMTSRTCMLAVLSTVKITYRTETFGRSENTGHVKIRLRAVLVEKLACCFLNNRSVHESNYL